MNNSDTNQAEQLNETAVMQSVLAKDLRLGNSILKNGKIYEITTLFFVDLHDGTIRENYNNNYVIEPIPLNEEWLLKFGFEFKKIIKYKKSYTPEHYKLNNFSLTISNKGYYVVSDVPIYIFFVHQLQNLYFALTGSELTVA